VLVIAIIGPCDSTSLAYCHDSRTKVEGTGSGEAERGGVEVSDVYDADTGL